MNIALLSISVADPGEGHGPGPLPLIFGPPKFYTGPPLSQGLDDRPPPPPPLPLFLGSLDSPLKMTYTTSYIYFSIMNAGFEKA